MFRLFGMVSSTAPVVPAPLVPLVALLTCAGLLAGVGATPAGEAVAAPGRAAERPNILLITADDMRADDLRFMPFTRGEFRRRAVTFSDAVSPYPLCCPARATIVTGQYNHNNGVQGNAWPNGGYWALRDPGNTLPVWLRRQGYRTAFIGKYMNELEKDPQALNDPEGRLEGRRRFEVPPGWTHWIASVGFIYRYTKVRLNVDGPTTAPHRKLVRQYQTDYFSEQTTRLIRRYHRADRPFFIWASHLAPHVAAHWGSWVPPLPARQDVGSHRTTSLPSGTAYREALNAPGVQIDGPMADRPPVSARAMLRLHRARAESLLSLDRAVRDAVLELKRTGEYANTTIIFTSDNGYLLGELRLKGKDQPYEPALRVPMIVNARGIKTRYGGRTTARLTVPYTVTTTDIASTVVGVAGVSPGRTLDGVDMTRPRLNPDAAPGGDRIVLIESGARGPTARRVYRFSGVRTDRWTWFTWNLRDLESGPALGPVEYYDRAAVPAQTSTVDPDSLDGPRLRDLTLDMYDCVGSDCVRSLS